MSSRVKSLEQRIKDMQLDFDEIKELFDFVVDLYSVDQQKCKTGNKQNVDVN
ncbi:MAG: hypothetical protein QX198_07350 [Methylococcaceae bacterium]